RQRKVETSLDAAKGTAELLRQLVTSSRLSDPQSLLDEVKRVGLTLQAAQPTELVIGNIARRVLHIIREEVEADEEGQDEDLEVDHAQKESAPAMGGLSRAFRLSGGHGPATKLDASRHQDSPKKKSQPVTFWARKQEVIDGVNDLIEELKDIDSSIANQAVEHIHANEVILTFGYSRTVLQFLKRAREKRFFQAVVAEAAPTYEGQRMARELAALGIQTTAISDSAIYAMMARVNKVVVTAHALLADGGIMAPIGMHLVAMAAKHHAVPFVVLVGIYKLTPLFAHEPGLNFNELKSPASILPYNDEALLAADSSSCLDAESGLEFDVDDSVSTSHPYLQVHNPSFDYVPPALISLFITDQGHGFMPSYVYRQLYEWYHKSDW
ncbi:Translation initiation factor eIF-2B subunit beta, partial [Auxenochlorella protothecoides]